MPERRAVFRRCGHVVTPTGLARGPWRPDALHGGAPAGLLAALAEEAAGDNGSYSPVRMTMEFLAPVPLAPLKAVSEVGEGRSVRRVSIVLSDDRREVARALILFVSSGTIDLQVPLKAESFPALARCTDPVRIPGMEGDEETFHYTAVESRLAGGSVSKAGPAAAWLRLRYPLVQGLETTPFVRAVAMSDFGNGLSWAVPLDRYVFANMDLSIHLQRPPDSEWIGVSARTAVEPSGVGITYTSLHDERGPIGMACQSLMIRAR